ncbi:E3 ubiquitin-protein ligase SH3RF3 [Grus japonensis]|uniref:E3 ubiquitin-protein ligase SH3RF3 n=1 Tax=Grus japonensis TaxID=30415 RepID=A0ABC9W4G3_GRUJA
MDESSLLDLLECSVCLERLDTTAKVLPCQHTFCRRCLESIVSSRHELRCPECRILVGCGVDELPANILLVRLLDGIRQRPRAAGGASGSPSAAAPAYPQPAAAPSAVAAAAASAAASLRELAAASRSALLGKFMFRQTPGAGRVPNRSERLKALAVNAVRLYLQPILQSLAFRLHIVTLLCAVDTERDQEDELLPERNPEDELLPER